MNKAEKVKKTKKKRIFRKWLYQNHQLEKLPDHIHHLPLITRHFDLFSFLICLLWSQILKRLFFKFYLKITIKGGDFNSLISEYPKLLVVSNHSSHLDAISIASSIPLSHWKHLYTTVAKDYFFSNIFIRFFAKHCLRAVPIDRSYGIRESLMLCTKLIEELSKIWLVVFPEGTRSQDGKLQPFKRGITLLAEKTKSPILFLFLEGTFDLWPKGRIFPPPGGKITLHIGPVHSFISSSEDFYEKYKQWVNTLPLS